MGHLRTDPDAPLSLLYPKNVAYFHNSSFLQKEVRTKANAQAILQAFAMPRKGLKKIMDEAQEQARSELNLLSCL